MNYKISIPKPCHEDWNGMTPNEQGRFCMKCSKTVTDFTGMKASEIQSYLLENSGNKVCGRFTEGQLNRVTITVPERVLYTQTRFRNVFLLALLVTMGTTLLSCNNGQKIDKVAIEKDSGTTDSSDVQQRGTHTLGVMSVPDSLPPAPQSKSCGPLKGKVDMGMHKQMKHPEVYMNGAVAIDTVTQNDDYPMMGDIVITPKADSLPTLKN